MVIKKVQIKNFQSHVQTELELHPHLNVIVGPSNAGKSAVLRALKKAIRDLPAGVKFIHGDSSTCEITIETDTAVIKRRVVRDDKSNTKTNEYYLGQQLFGSFGREIPLEIVDALNMSIVNFGDKLELDLHFAGQHDNPFLVNATASVKSKVLGRISGLNIVDEATQTVKTETRQANNTLKIVDKDVEQLNTELQALPDINVLEEQVVFCEKKLDEVTQKYAELEQLQILSGQLIDIVRHGKALQSEVSAFPDLSNLDFAAIRTKVGHWTQLEKLATNLSNLDSQINTLENDPTLEMTVTSGNFENVKLKMRETSKLNQLNFDITQKDTVTKQIECDLERSEDELHKTKQEWEQLLKELGICPTCKQPTKNIEFRA